MKKTIEFENKIIMVTDHDTYVDREVFDTFEEAYKAMRHRYTDKEGFWWDIDEWEEDYGFEEAKGKFEAYGYVEFCDRDEITTTEMLLNQILREIDD